jgi:non-ribosomal peptide synthetase component F
MNIDNRYRDELKSIIGMFENIIPLRCQLDPHWSFHQLVEHIQEIAISNLEYYYFPLQRILAQHSNASKPAFLDTSFEFYSINNKKHKNEVVIGDSRLHVMPFSIKISEDEIMSKFDFILSIQYNSDINQLSCAINASLDLFDTKTVEKTAIRFHSMLEQLFQFTNDDQMNKPIYELSLILSDERLLMQSVNNTEVSFLSAACIHHEFVCQAINHSQKLAVELDEQSLTYSELLYYVQLLSLNLLNTHGVISGEIVCQCVERSLSMVS